MEPMSHGMGLGATVCTLASAVIAETLQLLDGSLGDLDGHGYRTCIAGFYATQ